MLHAEPREHRSAGELVASIYEATAFQRRIIRGLFLSNVCEVSASEAPEIEALENAGIVETWAAMGGAIAWRLTAECRAAIQAHGGTP